MGKPANTIHFTKNGRTDVSTIFDGNFYITQFVVFEIMSGYSAQTDDLYVCINVGHFYINAVINTIKSGAVNNIKINVIIINIIDLFL